MSVKLEARQYGPESTPEEIEAIRSRMQWLEPGVILWKEVPVMSLFSVEQATDKLTALTTDSKRFRMIVDLTDTASPPPPVRDKLMAFYKGHPKIECFAIYNGKNFVANVFARLMGAFIGLPISFHKTFEDALEQVRRSGGR